METQTKMGTKAAFAELVRFVADDKDGLSSEFVVHVLRVANNLGLSVEETSELFESHDGYSVRFLSCGQSKLDAIKSLRRIVDIELLNAKMVVEGTRDLGRMSLKMANKIKIMVSDMTKDRVVIQVLHRSDHYAIPFVSKCE